MKFKAFILAIVVFFSINNGCTPKYITQTYKKGVAEYNDSLYSHAILNFRLVYSVKPQYKKTLYYSGKTMLALKDTTSACYFFKQGMEKGKMQKACVRLYGNICTKK